MTAGADPSSTPSGGRRRPVVSALVAAALCLSGPLLDAGASPQPPAASPGPAGPPPRGPHPATPMAGSPPSVGDPAPDFPLFDPQGQQSSLHEALKDHAVVLVFYIGST